MDNIAFLQDRLKQGEADKRTLEARIKNLDLNVRDLNGQVCYMLLCCIDRNGSCDHSLQLIRMGVRNISVNPRSYHDNLFLRHSVYMQAEAVPDGSLRVSFIFRSN